MGKHAANIYDATYDTPADKFISTYDPTCRYGVTYYNSPRRAAPAHADPDAYSERDKPGKHLYASSCDATFPRKYGPSYGTYDPNRHVGFTSGGIPRHGGKRHAAADR